MDDRAEKINALLLDNRFVDWVLNPQNPYAWELISLDAINRGDMVVTPNVYYLSMVCSELQTNPNLEQINSWEEGTFDPIP